MADIIEEYFFNPDENVKFGKGGDLPHRHQNEKIQYLTFRLADSLPLVKRIELSQAIEKFKEKNPEPWDEKIQKEYQAKFSPAVERLLHNGYGDCVLKNPEVRKLLEETILYLDGVDYEVIAYVIMPNHVHLLLRPFGEKEIKEILQSIKSVSAHKINSYMGRKGELWLRESFDKVVRSRDQFKHFIKYIINNPKFLQEKEFSLYLNNPYGL